MNADTFFQELKRLITSFPKDPSKILNSEGSDYCSSVYYCKNVYYGFDVINCKDCAYITNCLICVNSIDIDYSRESELCYESVDAIQCYNCSFIDDCLSLRDSDFCTGCVNCHDVFGCARLKNKSFCIFNRQFSEAEYKEQVKKYKLWPADKVLEEVEKLDKRFPVNQTHELRNENSPYGNYNYYNKNCYYMFDASYNEYCGYLYDTNKHRNCYDVTLSTDNQLSYEVVDSTLLFNSNYIFWSKSCVDSWYLLECFDVKNSIGCVNLEHKQYCILNRQLAKEDYERISKPLLAELAGKNYGWASL